MKLYAVVDSKGGIVRADQNKILLEAAYLVNISKFGWSVKELHTYDPASQVVMDRDVALALLDSLVALREANVFVWPNHPMNPEKHLKDAINKFLSAGKEAT